MQKLKAFTSRKEWNRYLWSLLVEKLRTLKSKKDINIFFKNLLSSHERDIMLKRMTATLLLKEKMSYRAISELLWISPATLSAINKSSKNRMGYNSRRDIKKAKLKNNAKQYTKQKNEDPISAYFEWLSHIQIPSISGRDRWKFLSHLGRD